MLSHPPASGESSIAALDSVETCLTAVSTVEGRHEEGGGRPHPTCPPGLKVTVPESRWRWIVPKELVPVRRTKLARRDTGMLSSSPRHP